MSDDANRTAMTFVPVSDDELRSMLRTLSADDGTLAEPPAAVWASIEAALAADEPAVGDQYNQAGDLVAPDRSASDVAVVRPWRHRIALVAIGAAAAFVVALGASVVLRPGRAGTTLAGAALSSDRLPGAPTGLLGDAKVVERNGHRYLHIETNGLAPRSGEFLELWMIDRQVKGMVSLGVVDRGGDYELPDSLRYADFPIVDISTEPYDGKPTHSGASLLRGTLA